MGMHDIECPEYLLQKPDTQQRSSPLSSGTTGPLCPLLMGTVLSSSYTGMANMSGWTLCFLKCHKQLNNFTAVAVMGFCHEPVGTMWLGHLTELFQNLD